MPELQALANVHGPLSIIHFEAHGDTGEEYWGEKCNI
ncbi:arginase family protein [Bacillus sp. X1(2014)]